MGLSVGGGSRRGRSGGEVLAARWGRSEATEARTKSDDNMCRGVLPQTDVVSYTPNPLQRRRCDIIVRRPRTVALACRGVKTGPIAARPTSRGPTPLRGPAQHERREQIRWVGMIGSQDAVLLVSYNQIRGPLWGCPDLGKDGRACVQPPIGDGEAAFGASECRDKANFVRAWDVVPSGCPPRGVLSTGVPSAETSKDWRSIQRPIPGMDALDEDGKPRPGECRAWLEQARGPTPQGHVDGPPAGRWRMER